MLNLLPTQPPEAPAKHESLASFARFRARLENCPDDRNGNWHDAATTAWTSMLAIESMVSRLLEISADAPSQDASEAIDYAIDQLVEAAATVTKEAERRAEEDAPPYNSEDYWPRYRG
jgi:hypothetical protein